MKTRKYTFTIKIIIVAIVVFTITILLIAYLSITQSRSTVNSLMENRMLNTANSASAMVDGDDIKLLQGEISDSGKEPFHRVIAVLTPFYKAVGLKYIYAIKKLDNGYGVVADPDFESEDEYGELIEVTPALESAFSGVPAADHVATEDRWGVFYSAFSPIHDSTGEIVGVVGVDYDADWFDNRTQTLDRFLVELCLVAIIGGIIYLWIVTRHERRELDLQFKETENLRKMNEKIVQVDSVKRDFLERMSLEIREPVNRMIESNRHILDKADAHKTVVCAQNIETAGQSLGVMVDDILDYIGLENGTITLDEKEYELKVLLDSVVEKMRPVAEEKGLVFSVYTDDGLPAYLMGDETKIRQVLMNLLSNANKFTTEGEVIFSVSQLERNDDSVTLLFSVEDTGCGIKEEDMERLFLAFERFEREKNHVSGTGLGTALVKKLLVMMGSDIDVKSVYGQGSVFSFKLTQKVTRDR